VKIRTPDDKEVEISQEELEEAITDLVDRALAPVEDCLRDLRMAPLDVDDILVIGGTSQIPSVRAAVAEALQMEPVPAHLCDPMTAVARGVAIAAAVLAGTPRRQPSGQLSDTCACPLPAAVCAFFVWLAMLAGAPTYAQDAHFCHTPSETARALTECPGP
jgi:molecular chaperone DnaK (HSP70)